MFGLGRLGPNMQAVAARAATVRSGGAPETDPEWDNVVLSMPLHSDVVDLKGNTTAIVGGPGSYVESDISGLDAFTFTLDEYVQIQPDANLNFDGGEFTVELFSKAEATADTSSIMAYGNYFGDATDGLFLRDASSNIRAVIRHPGTPSTTPFGTFDNSAHGWHHHALTRVGNIVYWWVDGVFIQSVDVTGKLFNTTYGIRLGHSDDSGASYDIVGWAAGLGSVRDFRITKGVARYTEAFTPHVGAFPTS